MRRKWLVPVVPGLVNLQSILGWTELVAERAVVACRLDMRGLHVLPQPGPGGGLPPAGDALPPTSLGPLHVQTNLRVEQL